MLGALLPTVVTVDTVVPVLVVPGLAGVLPAIPGKRVVVEKSDGKHAAIDVHSSKTVKTMSHFFRKPPPKQVIFPILLVITFEQAKSNCLLCCLQKIKGMPRGIPEILGC